MARRVAPCTQCHGDEGRATPDGYYPRIAGKPVAYLYSQLLGFRDGRRTHPAMVGIVSGLSDAYLFEMAQHFANLNPPYGSVAASSEKPAVLALGERIALIGSGDDRLPACASCHGQSLTGLDPVMPGLTGLSRDYLNAQLGAWSNGARKAAAPDCMADIVKRMRGEEISAVAAWLASQPVAKTARPDMQGRRFALECGTHKAGPRQVAGLRSEADAHLKADASASARRGAYLATLGNCAGCHSMPGKPAFAGGQAIETPYGAIYANNITPHIETGIGRWSADDFYRALTQGISRDGHRLYPAFPWPYYARFSRSDSDDLYAFLRQLDPIEQVPRAPRLRFPYDWRGSLAFWTATNSLRKKPDVPAASADPQLIRGEWLVNGPGHCGACHTPKGLLGQDDGSRHLAGADMPVNGWYAPGLGASDDARYLHAGVDERRMAAGPMAHVIAGSLQFWTAADIDAARRYIQSLPAAVSRQRPSTGAALAASDIERSVANGEKIYRRQCADCHGERGGGEVGKAPALQWPARGDKGAVSRVTPLPNAVRAVLNGGYAPATSGNPRPYGMPPFRNELSSQAIADVLTFMAVSWKSESGAVSAADVDRYRGN